MRQRSRTAASICFVAVFFCLAFSFALASNIYVTVHRAPRYVRSSSWADTRANAITLNFSSETPSDELICAVAYGSARIVTNVQAPGGFTQLTQLPVNSSTSGLALFSRRLGPSESSGHYAFSLGGPKQPVGMAATCQEWAQVDQFMPISAVSVTGFYGRSTASSASFSSPALGTSAAAFFSDDEVLTTLSSIGAGWAIVSSSIGSGSVPITLYAQTLNTLPSGSNAIIGASIGWTASPLHNPLTAILLLNPVGASPVAPEPLATPTIAPTAAPIIQRTASPTPIPTTTPTATPSASPTPTVAPTASPAPTATPTAIPVLMTYIKQLNPSNLNCGATPAPDGKQYSCLHGYVRFAENNVSGQAQRVAAEVPWLMNYFDVVNPCPNTNAAPYNCYPDANPEHSPAMSEFYFEHSALNSAARIVDTTSGGNPVTPQTTPNPVSKQQQDTRYHANLETAYSTVSQGVNSAVTGDDSIAVHNGSFFDDSNDPGDVPCNSTLNWWSWVPYPFTLSQNTGASGHDVCPYGNYNESAWLAGADYVIQHAPHQVIYNLSGYSPQTGDVNGNNPPAPPSAVHMVQTDANAIGLMQEGTWGNQYVAGGTSNQNGRQPMCCGEWSSNENLEIAVMRAGKFFVTYEHTTASANHTLTASVSAGTQTVTPTSMIGIVPGSTLSIGSDSFTVTSTTQTTFAATFGASHASGSSIAVPSSATDPAGYQERIYAYASSMLTMDNPSLFIFDQDYASTVSGIPTPVEATLIPANPLVAQPTNYSAGSPTITGIAILLTATQGTHPCHQAGGATTGRSCIAVREYAQCTIRSVPIGGCAAVVAPDQPLFSEQASADLMPFPTLTGTYHHTLGISGLEAVPGRSDSGSLSTLGPAPPAAGTMVHSQQAWILTQ